MEILNRAKDGCKLVPDGVSQTDMREEVNHRTSKAGYTTKYGECLSATKIQTTVPFGETKLNVWPRDKNGQLIE